MKERHTQDYFIGLDLGTNSVGWAVTDTEYNVLKANRKSLWGVRLFDTAKTAEDRRLHRSARRRNQRKVQRLRLLQGIFEAEIDKVDKRFFPRLQESFYHLEDRSDDCPYTLFNDSNYTDKEFHRKFPTIYHLRSHLIHGNGSDADVRELFLALHSILKNRGHFLFSGESLDNSSSLSELIDELKNAILNCFNIDLRITLDDEAFGDILKLKRKTEKRSHLNSCFVFSSVDDQFELDSSFKDVTTEIKTALASSYFRVSKLFANVENSEFSPDKIEFDNDNYESSKDALEAMLDEDEFRLVEVLEGIYNWSLLSEILQGFEFISDAKVQVYETHKSQLRELKSLVRRYAPESYNKAFKSLSEPKNYVHYVGKGSKNGELVKAPHKSKCSQEDVNGYFLKILKPHKNEGDEKLSMILDTLEMKGLLPKLRVKDNRVVPYQLNLKEAKTILNNYKETFPFLTVVDEDGYTPIDKIVSMATFRIPYYVGPLNTAHKIGDGEEGFAWMVRHAGKEGEDIYPWNFDTVVDTEASAEKFIKRMTNKCTYLLDEDVVPKNSLLYNRYMVLNELNNLRINSEPVSVALKQQLYNGLFLTSKTRITAKRLKSFLVTNNIVDKNEELVFTGIDNGFTNTLGTWIDFGRYLDEGTLTETDVENIIEWKAIFGEDSEILVTKIREELGGKLNESQISQIVKLIRPYSGWGRLSRKLLEGIEHEDYATGELHSIISLMWDTNNNLMELLSSTYQFAEEIERINAEINTQHSFRYETLVEPLQLSPAVKRPIWQTLLIVNEIKKIMKSAPKKIFIEMAREKTEGGRTKSRKQNLQDLYASCKSDLAFDSVLKALGSGSQAVEASIEGRPDEAYRNDRLYLYYIQMGKCFYSGQSIELNDLYNTNLYDIDHIYPQSLIKDDSLNNRVLVKANYNSEKSNTYPIKAEWQDRMEPFWKMLADKEFISKEKYYRLTRRTQLTDEELASFINRQLVETRQGSLQVARLLENMFDKDDTRIVYVKAPNVSAFRSDFDIQKSRLVNDFHHAHDAYLNIVVGNVYHTKFTSDATNFFKKNWERTYNIRKLFYYDVVRQGQQAWEADAFIERHDRQKKCDRLSETGTIRTIRETLRNNQVLVTTKPVTGKGELFDLQPVKRGKDLLPLKASNPVLTDTEKYGGYLTKRSGYFFIAEHTLKGKRVKQILTVPIMQMGVIKDSESALIAYCQNDLALVDPIIIVPSIHIFEHLNMDGFEVCLRGITGNAIIAHGAHQLILPEVHYDYFVQLEKFNNILAKKKTDAMDANVLMLAERFSISKEKNLELYALFLDKEKNSIYSKRPANQSKLLSEKTECFKELDILQQTKALLGIVDLFTCNANRADLSLLGGGSRVGAVQFSSIIKGKVSLIRKSPTGVFVQEVPIS